MGCFIEAQQYFDVRIHEDISDSQSQFQLPLSDHCNQFQNSFLCNRRTPDMQMAKADQQQYQLIQQHHKANTFKAEALTQQQFKKLDQSTYVVDDKILNIRHDYTSQVRKYKVEDQDLWLQIIRHGMDLTKFFTQDKQKIVDEINAKNQLIEDQRKLKLIEEIIDNNKCNIKVTEHYHRLKEQVFSY